MATLTNVATRRGADATGRRAIARLGRFIARRRKLVGLSQEAFGRRLGLTQGAVSEWERGVSPPDWLLWAPIAHQLDVTIGELLSEIWKLDRSDGALRDPTVAELAEQIIAQSKHDDVEPDDGSDDDADSAVEE